MRHEGARRRRQMLPFAAAVSLALLCAPAAASPEPAGGGLKIGSGELLWMSPEGPIPLPVVDLRVEITITGVMARGRVHQTFSNPTPLVIEAVYAFPLPERAAVDAMEMRIGDRRITAVLQEKEEALATYETARREGRKASLLDQQRPNLFTTSVANVNPGESVAVRLEYVQEVDYLDGVFSLTVPLAFTPRYDPAGGTAGAEPPAGMRIRLVPRVAADIVIRAGMPLDEIRSPSHPILATRDGDVWRVTLENSPVAADRDLVLRWKVRRGAEPAGIVFVERRDDERYALAMLLPPDAGSEAGWGMPTETLFIIDVSGSMDGPSIRQARRALLAALDGLRAGDTFNILKFNDRHEAFREGFVSIAGSTLDEARGWVAGLRATGGTEILPALVRGMQMMADADPWPARRIVLITDGAVANEDEVFTEVARRLQGSRLHLIGIGPAPNRYLMRKLARFGRGWCEFIGSPREVEPRMISFLGRIDRPVMTGVTLDWGGAPPPESYPAPLPDLHAGEPVFVSLRLGPGRVGELVSLRGRLAGGPASFSLSIAPDAPVGSGVATRWARARVESLMDSLHEGAEAADVRREVIAVASRFNLVTRYTSLVAVDHYPTARSEAMLAQGGTRGRLLLLIGALMTAACALVCLILRRGR